MGDSISIGMMGLGVIGTGVIDAIRKKSPSISKQTGIDVKINKVLVRDRQKHRGVLPSDLTLIDDPSDILEDPEIRLIIEVIGGEHPAYEYVSTGLRNGKHIVTANKELMAKHGPALLHIAEVSGRSLRFEGSVGGGIPIIGPLSEDLAANELTAINAVINGTTNYILTRMANEGVDYATALLEAQNLGYAESNPKNDIDGTDAAFKLAILASLAFHITVDHKEIFREGIERLTPADFRYAGELGYAIKLLATARQLGDRLQARVHPVFLPDSHPLAKVEGVYNAIELEGDLINWAMFQGPGAGAKPTSSAILSDVRAIVGAIGRDMSIAAIPAPVATKKIEPMSELLTKYYIRLRVIDEPGVMAQITKELGNRNVSLASVIQKEVGEHGKAAEIVITTHVARESDVQAAILTLSTLSAVDVIGNIIRVEEYQA